MARAGWVPSHGLTERVSAPTRCRKLCLLLASSSVAALLVGGGAPRALAACSVNDVGVTVGLITNSTGINCINVQNSTVTGNLTNTSTGVITANSDTAPSGTGITINNATVGGAITNSGRIVALFSGILVENNATVSGGVANSGTISAGGDVAIDVDGVSAFAGGISNSGTVSAEFFAGIFVVGVTSFTGGISNAGTISAPGMGIRIADVTTFTGGISNSGTISTHEGLGILVDGVTSFADGIGNSGTISAGATGINLSLDTTFTGGVSNGGTIAAGEVGIGLGQRTTGVTIPGVSSFTGNISNSGTITAQTGIAIYGSTITGAVVDSGTINASSHGILIDSGSKIVATGTAISITGQTFTGGVSNAGTIMSASDNGIDVAATVTSFSGGISNSGAISAKFSGILVDALTFGGGIVNSGTIAGGPDGINVVGVTAFSGGIGNSGTISANGIGIAVSSVSSFAGGISNGGTISASTGAGIEVISVTTFASGIGNSGTISAGESGIFVQSVTSFSGGISNTGRIASATGDGVVLSIVANFVGGISNSGTISVSGTGVQIYSVGNFANGVSNSGTIAAGENGIQLGVSGIVHTTTSTFGGGISNSGTIAADEVGIFVGGKDFGGGSFITLSTFAGGISNSGTISAGGSGIWVGGTARSGALLSISNFAGGISNSGTISAGGNGIFVGGGAVGAGANVTLSTFSGGIVNSGKILAHGAGIFLGATTVSAVTISSFGGGISNSGTIIARTGIAFGLVGVETFTGAIVNSGTISGTGGTAINLEAAPNAITFDQTGGLIAGNILLSANADVLNISGGTIAGNIVGAGSSDTINFNMGAGTFTYGTAYSFTGINQVNVNSGTVILDGTNSATTIDVTGGTLAGTGTLDPLTMTIYSGATFAPGTPGVPGTSMTITGNLAFQSGAFYAVYLNPTTSSFATVQGTASLAGTVQANFTSGSYVSKQYTILTTTGGLGGTTFAGLTNVNLPSGASDSLSYNTDDVFLNLTAPFTTFAGLNTNQQNVANALTNYFNTTGGIPGQFFGLTPGGLTQIDGEDATGAERGAFDLMNEFLGLMLDPFVDGRGGSSTGGGALGFAPDQEASLPPDVALAYAGLLKASPPQTFNQRWSTWASGFGGSATTDGDPTIGSSNVTTSTYGYAAGLDYHYSPDTVFGFSLAGGGTNWDLAQGLGTGRSDAFLAGIYGVTHEGPWYLGGALAFANNWFTTNRTAMGDALTASFEGQSYSARLEGGYRFAVPIYHGAAGVTPYAALQVQDFQTPAYSETDLTGGGFGLSYNAMNGTDTRSELGGRFDDLTTLDNLPLILRAKLAWAHDWVSNPALNASFESLPGSSFTVNGAPIPQNSALTSAGAQLFFTPNWSFLAKFDGEFANGSQLYAGSGTLRYTW